MTLILALAMVLSLFGCGASSTTEATKAPEATLAPAPTASGDSRPYEGQTLSLLFMSGTYADAARSIEAEFEKRTGADIEIVDFPYATLHEKMLLDFTSNSAAYDVVSVACQWDGEMAPFMEPLDAYIARDSYDIEAYDQNILDNCGRWAL